MLTVKQVHVVVEERLTLLHQRVDLVRRLLTGLAKIMYAPLLIENLQLARLHISDYKSLIVLARILRQFTNV